jgi:hypothetical protein
MRLMAMPNAEEYRNRAKEARNQANECRNGWERHGLLTIAEHCERLAVYKELTSASVATKNVGPHSTADEDAAWQAVGAPGQASLLINLKKAPATDDSGDEVAFAQTGGEVEPRQQKQSI